jgi:hypothetical protein
VVAPAGEPGQRLQVLKGDWVCEHGEQPDEGIWETRGGRRTSVLAADVLGGDRADDPYVHPPRTARRPIALRADPGRDLPADHAALLAPTRRRFVQHEDGDVLDAAVLVMPLAKFTAPTDPKWLSTLDALGAEVSDSLVYWVTGESGHIGVRCAGSARLAERCFGRVPPLRCPLHRAHRSPRGTRSP